MKSINTFRFSLMAKFWNYSKQTSLKNGIQIFVSALILLRSFEKLDVIPKEKGFELEDHINIMIIKSIRYIKWIILKAL